MRNRSSRPIGRPRTFDRDTALDRAVSVFWEKGYSGTSLDDLTEGMGIKRSSLYSSFGSKHELFIDVIDRYAVTLGCQPVNALCSETDIKKAVAAFLEASICCVTSKGGPKGCLISTVATEEAETDDQIRNKLSILFDQSNKVIADHFVLARDQGQLPHQVDPRALARMTVSMTHSFATRARVGVTRTELRRLAKEFMALLFPTAD